VLFSNYKPRRINHGEFKVSDFEDERQSTIQTGSAYFSESMIDIVKIPTANLGFTTMQSLNSVDK